LRQHRGKQKKPLQQRVYSFAPFARWSKEPEGKGSPDYLTHARKDYRILSRIEKDQSGIELMNSGKGEFVNLSEELTDDAVSIEDIDEVLQTLERANIVEAETEEPLIEETSSSVETEEG
jgi:hypothetical protein